MNKLLPIGTKLIATKDFKNIKKGDIGEISKYITETIYRVEFLNDYWSITNLLTFSGVEEVLYGVCMQVVQENPSMELTIKPPEGCVVDEENSTFQKIVFKKVEKEIKCWEDLGKIYGYFVDITSIIYKTNLATSKHENKNVFATKEQAEASIASSMYSQLKLQNNSYETFCEYIDSMKPILEIALGDLVDAHIALAKLARLVKEVNGNWKPDWIFADTKYVINFSQDSVTTEYWTFLQHFLSFPTAEIRDKFLENQIELIEQAKPFL